MKKQTKVLVTLSAAALLAVGASAVSFAEGWDNSTGVWQYLNKDGEAVTDEWKSSNGQWFWLDDDGVMATDSVIEDDSESNPKYYYVDANGARVTNTWKAVAKDDDDDSDAEYYWMYFGSDGKAYTTKDSEEKLTKSKLKTINGLKYAFDAKGHMLYGWISETDRAQHDSEDGFWREDGVKFYANGWNDGHIQTGWKQLTVMNADDEEKDYWFYFGSDGELVKNKQKKINGVKYSFAEDGHMLDEWVAGTNSDASEGTVGQLSYFNGDGAQRKNKWIYAVPAKDFIPDNEDYDNGDERWFYLNGSGKLTFSTIKKINGKKYAFDQYGRMKKNFVYANDDNDFESQFNADKADRDDFLKTTGKVTGNDKLYWFSDDEKKDGSLKKGYQTIALDDDTYQFYFNTSDGYAENGYVKKIKKFVANGLVVKPTDSDPNYMEVAAAYDSNADDNIGTVSSYVPVTQKDSVDGSYVMINKQGTVVKNKTKLKDEDDHYYVVNKNGFVVLSFVNEKAYNDFFNGKKTYSYTEDGVTKTGKLTASVIASNEFTRYSESGTVVTLS